MHIELTKFMYVICMNEYIGGAKPGVGLLYIRRNDYGSIEATDVLIL